MKKTLSLTALLLLCLFSCTRTREGVDAPYFATEELPDLIACLPAPPDSTSDVFAYDKARYAWGKAMRGDSLRAAQACEDADWDPARLICSFSGAFGSELSPEASPATFRLLRRSIATLDLMRVRPKAYFHRIRPYVYFNEPMLTRWEEEELRGEGSYPSGHTVRGWIVALLLAELRPETEAGVYRLGWRHGESRVIAGAHWQTDVDQSRVAAGIGLARLHESRAFRKDLDRARAECKK